MNTMFAIFNLGGGEIILILALVLILFGAKKLPELAKGLGTGIKEFKKATREVTEEVTSAMDDSPAPRRLPSTPPPETTPIQTTQAQPSQTAPQPTSTSKA